MAATYHPGEGLRNVHFDRLGDALWNQFKGWWGRPHAFVLLCGYLMAFVASVRQRRVEPIVIYPLTITVGYSALILWIYLTIFPEGMARSAHSYWRFLEHVQFFMVAGLVVFLFKQFESVHSKSKVWLEFSLIAFIIVGQIPAAKLVQPTIKSSLIEARHVAEVWKMHGLPPSVCVPQGFDDEQIEMLRYELRGKTIVRRCIL